MALGLGRALGDHEVVAAGEGREPAGRAGDQAHAEVEVRIVANDAGQGPRADHLHADVAVGDGHEVGARVGGGAVGDDAVGDQAAIGLDRRPGVGVVQRDLPAVGRQDVAAAAPDHRQEGERGAAAAVAREVEAVGVLAEGPDPARVVADLVPGLRGGLRVQARLLEQVLVPDQDRRLDPERHVVDAVLKGAERDVGGGKLIEVGQASRPVGDVLELPLRRKGRHEDQVERQSVGGVARRDGGGVLLDDLVARHGDELHLVLVARVVASATLAKLSVVPRIHMVKVSA